uniref:Uncharacterized protein n=1 Tax=Meloidogyne javanica TaxID=6303 RepID=A0A915N3T3_MELJA
MAIFGFHVILTLLSASVFGKIQGRLSLCDIFVFKGLYYYLLEGSLFPRLVKHKQVQQQKGNNQGGNGKRRGANASQKVTNNKSTEKMGEEQKDRLIRLPLNLNALEDLNASMIWTFCALILQIHILLNIAFEKVSIAELFPERNTLICATGLFFLGSLLFNAFADQFLDIEISKGYLNFINSLNDFLQEHGFQPLFSSKEEEKERGFKNIFVSCVLHFSFLAPVGVLLLFLRPIVEQILESHFITHEQLKSLRLLALFTTLFARIYASRICLQTFLDKPKKVANYASYACTAALQHYMPIAIILSIGLILKNLEFHEPLWTLALTTLICGQCLICLFGVIMRKTSRGR